MPQAQKIPFLKLFSAWKPSEELAALVSGYLVTQAVIDKHTRSIKASVECTTLPDETLRSTIERSLSLTYRVEKVELVVTTPAGEPAPAPAPIPEPEPTPAPVQAPPMEDEAAAAFRRTEEIRRKALASLKTPKPTE